MKNAELLGNSAFCWRRERDLNPIILYTPLYSFILLSLKFQGVEASQALYPLRLLMFPYARVFEKKGTFREHEGNTKGTQIYPQRVENPHTV